MSITQSHPFAPDDPAGSAMQHRSAQVLDAVAASASQVGHSAVQIAGFLEDLGRNSKDEQGLLTTIDRGLTRVLHETQQMETASQTVVDTATQTQGVVTGSVAAMQASGQRTIRIADWVSGVNTWIADFMNSLAATEDDLSRITHIAREVNILALNARIEAARAGSSGAGFSVIAEAIGTLARDTSTAAEGISKSLRRVRSDAEDFAGGVTDIIEDANRVVAGSKDVDQALIDIQRGIGALDSVASAIGNATQRVHDAVSAYAPDVRKLESAVRMRGEDIARLGTLSTGLIDTSEEIVQRTIGLGGSSRDQIFINRVQDDAAQMSQLLESALASGQITEAALFSSDIRPIGGTDPQQVVAPFTALTDRLFPAIQEDALGLSSRVVFCAAVDRNGYLPTHNRKFSQPQGNDPVWNAANCRNRRIFADRVGLKAGQSLAPFLLQVYRRDMGGGQYKIMMDVSAPIIVRGQHWGGLRLAFT